MGPPGDEVEVRSLDDGLRAETTDPRAPRLVGYAIRTGVLSEDLGGFRETITPQAIRRALEGGRDLVALRNHDTNHVLGRVSAKTLHVEADDRGLRFEIDVPEAERGLVESVARGDLTGASFAFSNAVDEWNLRTSPPTRTITGMVIREISAGAVWPAYPQTHVAALRSLERHQQQKEITMPDVVTPPAPAPTVDPVPPVPPVVTESRDVDIVGEERILTPADSYRAFIEREGRADTAYARLGFGAFLRAALLGPRTDLERRALAEGTDGAGGITVPDITLARFIDKLRAATVVFRAGAMTVPLTSDKTTIAKLTGDPTVAWRSENAEITAADPTFTGVQFTPRSLAALVRVSRELVEDSLNVEQMLERAFAESMAVELDRVALIGSGTPPEPRGISNTSNVNSVAGGGAQTNYDKLIDALYECWVDNVPVTSAIVMHPRTFQTYAKLKESTTDAPLARPPVLEGIPFLQTTGLSITEAPGTASRIIAGDFSRLMIGVRSSLRIEILRERYGEFLQYGFLAHLRADVAVEHPEAFTMVTGITP
jgi:HK97 family phage major capsid protein/HK97 family phage prohead protease